MLYFWESNIELDQSQRPLPTSTKENRSELGLFFLNVYSRQSPTFSHSLPWKNFCRNYRN